jgi:putative component of membrane protein insertase Oxa1/YidC/SpoIIIJ protein YidD
MFSLLFRKLIEQYWKRIPESERKVCIYKESCSKKVYSTLIVHGFYSGMKEYIHRKKSCRAGYKIIHQEGKITIITKNGLYLNEDEINPLIVKEAKLTSN